MRWNAPLLLALTLVSLASPHRVHGQAMTREVATERIATYDTAYPRIASLVDYWLEVGGLPTDFRKHNATVDMRRHVLPDALRARLATLRREAGESYLARDWPGTIITMDTALREIGACADRLRAVQNYWDFRALDIYRRKAWREVFDANRLPRSYEPGIAEIEQRLQARIRNDDFAGAMQHEVVELDGAYRAALQDARSQKPDGRLKADPMRRKRARPCKRGMVAGVLPSDAGVTRSARVNEQTSDAPANYYPPSAQVLGIGGKVPMRIAVDSQGCAEWAEATEWSAPPVLIQASLDWIIDGAGFVPALKDGQPVADEILYIAQFGLQPVVK